MRMPRSAVRFRACCTVQSRVGRPVPRRAVQSHFSAINLRCRNGKHGFTYNSNPGTMSVSGNVSIVPQRQRVEGQDRG